jgi:hypothetical protein
MSGDERHASAMARDAMRRALVARAVRRWCGGATQEAGARKKPGT